MAMKLTTGIVAMAMMAGGVWAQNPNIIDKTRSTMNSVQQQKTNDSNAALEGVGVSQAGKPAPGAPATKPAPAPALKPSSAPAPKPAPAAVAPVKAAVKPAAAPGPEGKTGRAKSAGPAATGSANPQPQGAAAKPAGKGKTTL